MISSNDGGGVVSIKCGKTWTEEDLSTQVLSCNDYFLPFVLSCSMEPAGLTVRWAHALPEGWESYAWTVVPGHGWQLCSRCGEMVDLTQSTTESDIFMQGSRSVIDKIYMKTRN